MLYRFEDYSLDTDRRELRCGTALVSIEPQVFDLLSYLIQHRERVVSKNDLIAAVWGGRVVSESALGTRINAARSAIGDNGRDQHFIKTFSRKGIRFIAVAREQETLAHPAGIMAEQREPNMPLADRPSIAVLPFANLSGDSEQDYFADGMAEEIITALSRCKWLLIIARNSSFTYKGRPIDVRQVGRELGVRYVLEGSVRRGGNRLRFTGQLIDATSGVHLWADHFDGEIGDIFALQDSFTASVVAAIEPSLQLAEFERLRHKPAASLDAYDLLLRAQQLEHAMTEDSIAAALRCLQQALAIDPTYAAAMALAAHCYDVRYSQGWMKDVEAETAEGVRLANSAVELGMDDGYALWLATWAIVRLVRDWPRGKELISRSLLLNPNSAIALSLAGWVEVHCGNTDKALELILRAERLNPRDPRGWFTATAMALVHFVNGQFKEAASWARKAAVNNPRSAMTLRFLAASLAKAGERDQAAEVVKELLKIEPDLTISKWKTRHIHRNPTTTHRIIDGLRLAGVPE